MQKLFYVVFRWLEEERSSQANLISGMIQEDMTAIGFSYQSIADTQRQLECAIREKQKLQARILQLERQRQETLRSIEEMRQLQKQKRQQKEEMEKQLLELQQTHEGQLQEYEWWLQQAQKKSKQRCDLRQQSQRGDCCVQQSGEIKEEEQNEMTRQSDQSQEEQQLSNKYPSSSN